MSTQLFLPKNIQSVNKGRATSLSCKEVFANNGGDLSKTSGCNRSLVLSRTTLISTALDLSTFVVSLISICRLLEGHWYQMSKLSTLRTLDRRTKMNRVFIFFTLRSLFFDLKNFSEQFKRRCGAYST